MVPPAQNNQLHLLLEELAPQPQRPADPARPSIMVLVPHQRRNIRMRMMMHMLRWPRPLRHCHRLSRRPKRSQQVLHHVALGETQAKNGLYLAIQISRMSNALSQVLKSPSPHHTGPSKPHLRIILPASSTPRVLIRPHRKHMVHSPMRLARLRRIRNCNLSQTFPQPTRDNSALRRQPAPPPSSTVTLHRLDLEPPAETRITL